MTTRLIGPLIASVLTLLVLSYVGGDNPLYRLVLHLFVGILLGYSLGVVVNEVLVGLALPRLLADPVSMAVPAALGVLLLSKGIPRLSYVGNVSIAYLVGVGTAVALGGALLGTLGPQTVATAAALAPASVQSLRFGLLDGIMIVVGTVCTLLGFSFTTSAQKGESPRRRPAVIEGAAWIGRVFLLFAFALVFAGALTASLSIFIGRMHHLIEVALQTLEL